MSGLQTVYVYIAYITSHVPSLTQKPDTRLADCIGVTVYMYIAHITSHVPSLTQVSGHTFNESCPDTVSKARQVTCRLHMCASHI